MSKNRQLKKFCYGFLAIFFVMVFWGQDSFGAFTLGNTYDKSNWEEVKDMLPEPVLNWVKKGEFILNTGKLDFDLAQDPAYVKESQKNKDKYAINDEGVLVYKDTGKTPDFVSGMPFPTIDAKDPKVAEKVMENYSFTSHYRQTGVKSTGYIRWVGESGNEREIVAAEQFLYYQNRSGGPVNNPNNFLQQVITGVTQPFDLRGTVLMAWTYNSSQTDTAFSYVPMLRRIRRVSAAARSDPFAGSDFCTDDSRTWNGKNASMKWKFLGQGTYLVPFSSDKKHTLNVLPDGSIDIYHDKLIKGYEVPGWKGAPWAPTNCTWNARPVWLLEGIPKDPYYNYGRQLFFVDQENFVNYYKVIYDQSGVYWKVVFYASNCGETTTGVKYIALPNYYVTIDDKVHHSCVAEIQDFPGELDLINMPIEKLGPDWFTESYIRQLSK